LLKLEKRLVLTLTDDQMTDRDGFDVPFSERDDKILQERLVDQRRRWPDVRCSALNAVSYHSTVLSVTL
jgi:hypothetical protein